MLTTYTDVERVLGEFPTVDAMEQELSRLEALVSQARARQVEILAAVDHLQVPTWDGTRSLKEWITGRLDIDPNTASDLTVLTKAEAGPIRQALAAGVMTVDRAAATTRLANTGASDAVLEQAAGLPISQIPRLAARHRRMSPVEETEAFRMRRLWVQPNLDNTLAHASVTMPGADVDTLLDALDQRADQLVAPGDPHRPPLEQRRLDALLSLALDTTAPQHPDQVAPRRLRAHIFIDATTAAPSNGQAGAMTESGIKVGPNTLSEILCSGDTQATLIDTDGLKAVPTDGDRIPQRLRQYVFHRDGGCVADGCTSTYRLETHHIKERNKGGDHHPRNLALLCWFHHHVVIHQNGHHIDPTSPPHRRRFDPPHHNRAPPNHN